MYEALRSLYLFVYHYKNVRRHLYISSFWVLFLVLFASCAKEELAVPADEMVATEKSIADDSKDECDSDSKSDGGITDDSDDEEDSDRDGDEDITDDTDDEEEPQGITDDSDDEEDDGDGDITDDTDDEEDEPDDNDQFRHAGHSLRSSK